jgi:penicillin-binding protein 2
VLVENGGFGAQAAAPIARQVMDYYVAGVRKVAPAPAVAMPETEDQSD